MADNKGRSAAVHLKSAVNNECPESELPESSA